MKIKITCKECTNIFTDYASNKKKFCNRTIGLLKDNIEILENAIKYIKKYNKPEGVSRNSS